MSGRPWPDAEAAAALLEGDDAFRVQRRVDLASIVGSAPVAFDGATTRVLAVADVETTGLEASSRIIELALRRLRIDAEGTIVEIGRPYCFLEDPGQPLDPSISRLTRLTDAELAGRAIDEALAVSLFRSAEATVFHNARFDAPRVLTRLPALAGMPVACSLREVDWRARDFDRAMNLSCLLCQAGRFASTAHRAGADVDATIAVLAHRDRDGRTAVAELLETASRPTLRFSAYGAAFGEPKDRLKGRGYRWDPDGRVWSREVAIAERDDEAGWLADNVYATHWRPKCEGPHVETVDWTTRHA